jgi:hypothetical protein
MLMQEKISGSDTLFKLYVATEEDLNVLQSQLRAQQLPVDQPGEHRYSVPPKCS